MSGNDDSEAVDTRVAQQDRPGIGLAARLMRYGLLAALLVCVVAGTVLRTQVHSSVWRAFDRALAEREQRVLARIEAAPDGAPRYAEPSNQDEFSRIFSGWYWWLESDTYALRSRSLWDAHVSLLGDAPALGLKRASGPQEEALLGRAQQVRFANGSARLWLFAPAAPVQEELRRFDRGLLVALVTLALTLSLAMLLQVRLGLRPLRRLRAAVAAAASGHRAVVGSGYGPDLDPLARELDAMFARNARVVERARSNAADLSHALKRPLALLMGASLAPSRHVEADQVRAQVQAMTRLIERHLARGGSGAGDRRRIAVASRVENLLALMQRLHEESALQWRMDVSPSLDWRGEPTDLDEMLGNLLDNAGKWARGRVEISASRNAHEELELRIADDGPGLAVEQLEQIAQRGRRFDESVEGNGLGLAIASDIAQTYGGVLRFDRSALGGLQVSLILPD